MVGHSLPSSPPLLVLILFISNSYGFAFGWTSSIPLSPKQKFLSHRDGRRLADPRLVVAWSSRGQREAGPNKILDVEFERVEQDEKSNKDSSPAVSSDETSAAMSKSWLEWSLEADPLFNSTRIPFLSTRTTIGTGRSSEVDSIDTKLAFLVDLDGVTYGIGVPFDHSAALTLEHPNGTVEYLPPTDDNEELMEIMAAQLHDHVSPDLQLLRTPRLLTIRGPLEEYTQNWREDLFPKPLSAEQLMDESDEDVEDFHRFMKAELGEDLYRKTLQEASDGQGENISPELLQLFDIPGLGDQEDNEEGIEELLRSILDSPSQQKDTLNEFEPDQLNHDGAALKLVSYVFPGTSKAYSLVSLFRPLVIAAKMVSTNDPDNGVRFELLSSQEEKVLIPRLEQVCQADLERAGLKLLQS